MATRKSFFASLGSGAMGALVGCQADTRSGEGEFRGAAIVDLLLPASHVAEMDVIDTYLMDSVARARDQHAPLRIPSGVHLFETAQLWEDLPAVLGQGVLKPTSALSGATALTINTAVGEFGVPPEFVWDGPVLDGALTSNCTGLLLGGNKLTARLHLRNGWVRRFKGKSACGIRVRNVVQTSFDNFMAQFNRINVLIEGGESSLPTTVRFSGCNLREAETDGVVIKNAHQVLFESSTIIESNYERGLVIQPGVGQEVRQVACTDTWFENNWLSLSGAQRTAKYAIFADGTAGLLRKFALVRPRFGESCRNVDLVSVVEGSIDSPEIIGAMAAMIRIRGSSFVHLDNWPHGYNADDLLDIAPGNVVLRDGAMWKDVPINFGNVAPGAQGSGVTKFTGVVIGDRVEITADVDQRGQRLWGYVNASDWITVIQTNNTAAAVNLGRFTARMHVRRS